MATVSEMVAASLMRGVVIPLASRTFARTGYQRSVQRAADDIVGEVFLERLLVGKGILRDHTGTDPLSGVALCGVPVSAWTGGGLADVQCHLCRAALHAAGRRASMRQHPAGRNRQPAVSGPASSPSIELRGRCDD